MALTTDETIRLGKLKVAYDKLLTGSKIAEFESDGERVKYSAANLPMLKAAIDALEAKASSATGRLRGGLRFSV